VTALLAPFTDRKGQFSPLKTVTFGALLLPALWLCGQILFVAHGGHLLNLLIHQTGLWSLRLLLVTLACTPLRLITGYNRIILLRRMLGVGALCYALAHFSLYIIDQRFGLLHIAAEIVLRFYLTIGFVSLLAMSVLGLTSTDGWVKKLGALRWNRLHMLVYPLTLLALWHGALQSKINVDQAIIMTGVMIALMGVRLMRRRVPITWLSLLALALVSALAAALVEYLWYKLGTGLPASRIFGANFALAGQPRPALIVLLMAAVLPLLALAARWLPGRSPQRSAA
jgi:methionine sulfoxide reductase heme-binding subunit